MNIRWTAVLFCWTLLCMDSCLSQRDCTGVDCPDPHNCIDSRLEQGSCCPTCTQRGCTCEGYQFYDCLQAGFQKGKVPEGESYFVDFGSTECSCPRGGGKISCRFIPCPEISPNCIDISQPADGCAQCRRVGCKHGNKKYEAGHSFHMDRCQVCHCPNEGGRLMCSPIPNCDLRGPNNPMWVPGSDNNNNNPVRDAGSRHDGSQTSHAEPFSKLALGNTLPLYKPDPPSFGTEDYDYSLAGPTSSTIQDLARPLESTTVAPAYPESSSAALSPGDDRRHELRETQPETGREAEVQHNVDPTAAEAQSETPTTEVSTTQGVATTQNHRPPQENGERAIRRNSDRNRFAQDTLRDVAHGSRPSKGSRQRPGPGGHSRGHGSSRHVSGREEEKVSPESRHGKAEQKANPTIQFSPTSRAPVRLREEGEQPDRQAQTLHNYQAQGEEESDTEGEFAHFPVVPSSSDLL